MIGMIFYLFIKTGNDALNALNVTQELKPTYTTGYISISNDEGQSGALNATQGHKPSYTTSYIVIPN